jgi:hypothetical protein
VKRLGLWTAVFLWAGTLVGCDPSDLNQDLKPIDPRTPRPKPALQGHGPGAKRASDRPAPVIQ